MGRKANWFRAVKQALGSECKEHKDQRSTKWKKKWFVKKKSCQPISKSSTTATDTNTTPTPLPPVAVEATQQTPVIPCETVNLKEGEEEDEQKRHAESIAIATEKATEAAAAEVVRLTNAAPFPGKPKEDVAAVRIQSAFRAYLARRALGALRELATLKVVIQGKCMKRPTTNTLKSMQTLARLQSQVRTSGLNMSEDNQGRMGHGLGKQVKQLEKVENLPQNGSDRNVSPKSKEQIEARLQSQHEAAIRRERALAYSLNHHQSSLDEYQNSRRNSLTSKSAQTVFMDFKNQHSGWSWLERWLAARPWETANNSPVVAAAASKKQASKEDEAEEDAKSVLSVQSDSDHNRRGSSVDADDYNDSIATSSPVAHSHTHTLPSYMAPTQSSTRAKKRPDNKHEATDSLSVCSANKTRSRHSASSITDANSISEHQSFVNGM